MLKLKEQLRLPYSFYDSESLDYCQRVDDLDSLPGFDGDIANIKKQSYIGVSGAYVEECIALLMGGKNHPRTHKGYDITLPSCEKLEVKSSHYYRDKKWNYGRWIFQRVDLEQEWDYLVCVCLPENGFDWKSTYIYKIPKEYLQNANIVNKLKRFVIRPTRINKTGCYRKNGHRWDKFLWLSPDHNRQPVDYG